MTDLVSDYLLKPMIKTTLTLEKMSWSAILTDIRRRRNDRGHSTHSNLILNDVRQSTMTRLKNQHINNCTARQYTAKSLDKLNMNMIKHFLTTRAPAVQKELRNVGARHTRSSERNYHRASSTTLDVFLILSRPSVVYFPKTHIMMRCDNWWKRYGNYVTTTQMTRRINHQIQLYVVARTSVGLSLQLNTFRSQIAFNDGASDHRRSAGYPFKMEDRSRWHEGSVVKEKKTNFGTNNISYDEVLRST